jgi:hypothetical protein
MTDKITCSIDHEYISDFYENGLEGAHTAIATSLMGIVEAGSVHIPGLDEEAFGNILRTHVLILDALARNVLIVDGPRPTLEFVKK